MAETNLDALKENIYNLGMTSGMTEEELQECMEYIDTNTTGLEIIFNLLTGILYEIKEGGGGGGINNTYMELLTLDETGSSGFGVNSINKGDLNIYLFDGSESLSGFTFDSGTVKERGMYKLWKLGEDFVRTKGDLNCIYYTYDDNHDRTNLKNAKMIFEDGYVYLLADEEISGTVFFQLNGILECFNGSMPM